MPVDLSHPTLSLDVIFFLLGICIGSFLNVVALRSLAEESLIWPPSKCPKCNHRLSPLDNIPVVSYAFLRGRCRYCRAPIHWQYPLVELSTALTFVAVERTFLDPVHSPLNTQYWNGLLGWFNPQFYDGMQQPVLITAAHLAEAANAMWHPMAVTPTGMSIFCIIGVLVLACTLIAVTVTDFREKLIPHEITYPSMIFGLIFSAVVRQDLLGALAGVGASYLLFDFIAFYGLKVYLWMHGGTFDEPVRRRRLRRRVAPRSRRRMGRGLRWRLDLSSIQYETQEEPLEVMGGGDAVLSAVMSAYLGWQLLVIALLIGFVAGTIMGLVLLFNEMRKAKLLHNCGRKAIIFGGGAATVLGGCGFLLPLDDHFQIAASLAALGGIGGALIAVVSVGTRVSKPYPFGPALAVGGFIAMFLLPNWLIVQPPLH